MLTLVNAMKRFYQDFIYSGFILLLSILSVFDLFVNTGKPANGDGLIHTLVPVLFAKALSQGYFPVDWVSGFANYGLPLGTVSQQLSTYLSAFVVFLTHSPTLGFNIVVFLGVFLSCLFFYFFLRFYFSPLVSFVAVCFFNFAPYRILNIYIRGALPEFFAGVFFPLLGIALYLTIVKRKVFGIFLFIVTVALLTLTHPFMDIVAIFLVGPYVLFLLFTTYRLDYKDMLKPLIQIILGGGAGLGLTAYYIVPLTLEIKYFYYGLSRNHLTPNNFLTLTNFVTNRYPYFTTLDVFNRGFVVNVGFLESFIFLCGFFYVFYRIVLKKLQKNEQLLVVAIFTGLLLLFLMWPLSTPIYQHVAFLSNIQFPWRMLSGFIFIPPIILATFLAKIKWQKTFALLFILIICLIAFPQLYGKNYTNFPYRYYTFTPYNLDAVVMNTIWTGVSNNYPRGQAPFALASGSAQVQIISLQEEKHVYKIAAKTPIQFVDHTFYFPGWQAAIDTSPATIQYQDPNYRGVITLAVPAGNHIVTTTYTDTKIRLLGKIISVISLLLLIPLYLLIQKFW